MSSQSPDASHSEAKPARNTSFLRTWAWGKHRWELGQFPRLMGIVNVTPDSFSDGGQWLDPARAVAHALELVEAGADVLDIGGESTRPGAIPVNPSEELRRVIPVIERLSALISLPISIDTMKAQVAQEALSAGASIVNDVSALTFDPEMIEVCARADCGIVLMHMQGTPQTMQLNPTYRDVVHEVQQFLNARLSVAMAAGIAPERVLFDPGIGFGKTAEHNLQLLSCVESLRSSGRPVLIGHSRKRFLSKLLGRSVEERLAGTIGVAIAVAAQHADLIRVHDIGPVRDALLAWRAIHGENFFHPAKTK